MRISGRFYLGALALLLAHSPAFAQADAVTKAAAVVGVAQKATIKSSGGGPYFRLTVPIAVYPTAAHVDLSDVRIRNATGVLVPHAWLNEATTEIQILTDIAAFYPVVAPKNGESIGSSDLSLEFKQKADGSLLTVRTKRPPLVKEKSDWVIDASQINGSLLQARFTVDDETEGLFPLTLESSDDLRHWRTVNADGQIAVLKRLGEKIEKLAVDLNGIRAKFLRLHWQESGQTTAIKSVTIDSVQQDEVVTPMQWSAPINASSCTENYCDYPLPARTPLDSLRISLSEQNTLAAITVSAQLPAQKIQNFRSRPHPLYVLRHKRQPPAVAAEEVANVVIGQSVAYRLKQDNGEVLSENLALDGGIYTRLRIQTQGPISLLGQSPPSIEVASTPRTLLFLGRGSAPFSLHWGVDDVGRALPLAMLVPDYQPNKPLRASIATVETIDIPIPAVAKEAPPVAKSESPTKAEQSDKTTTPNNKIWLWAALAVGLLLLAGMAWSLFSSMAKSKEGQ